MGKVGIIVQARVGSTRLPRKVLKPLPYKSEKTVLDRVLERLKRVRKADLIVVATTKKSEDDAIVEVAKKQNVAVFRGSEKDVLSRYYEAAKEFGIDTVVRITSDCPCIDPSLVDKVVDFHFKEGADYTRNVDFPRGLDVEVIDFKALERAHLEATHPSDREHVCPYIYRTAPEKFKLAYYTAKGKLKRPDIRITLDTEEDYALLCAVFDYLYPKNPFFGAEEVVELFEEKPWLALINRKVRQKKDLRSLEEELKEAVEVLRLQDLHRAKEILEKHLKGLERT